MANEFPSLNGVESSWADLKITTDIDGGELIEMSDIAGIKFGDKVSVGVRKGVSGGRVMAATQGEVETNLSITFYRSGFRKLVRGLKNVAPTRRGQKLISLAFFSIQGQSTPVGEDDIYEHMLRGIRILSRSYDLKEGTDADKIEVECFVTQYVELDEGDEISLI
jgi:hypothetical protein